MAREQVAPIARRRELSTVAATVIGIVVTALVFAVIAGVIDMVLRAMGQA